MTDFPCPSCREYGRDRECLDCKGTGLIDFNDKAAKFIEVAEENNWEWYLYHGRWFYVGPAINTDESHGDRPTKDDITCAMREVGVRVQWDNLAFDYVVYPVT